MTEQVMFPNNMDMNALSFPLWNSLLYYIRICIFGFWQNQEKFEEMTFLIYILLIITGFLFTLTNALNAVLYRCIKAVCVFG